MASSPEAAGDGVEERVDGCCGARRVLGDLAQPDAAVAQFRDFAGGQHENTVGLDWGAVGGLGHRHGCPARQDFRQHASSVGREVQHDDEGEAAIGRHPGEELVESLDAAGRGADGDQGGHVGTVWAMGGHGANASSGCRQRRLEQGKDQGPLIGSFAQNEHRPHPVGPRQTSGVAVPVMIAITREAGRPGGCGRNECFHAGWKCLGL